MTIPNSDSTALRQKGMLADGRTHTVMQRKVAKDKVARANEADA